MSYFTACKKSLASMNSNISRLNSHSFHPFFPLATRCFCREDFQRALVDESEVSSVDIIPPWFSVHTYHLGDEQQAPVGDCSSEVSSHPTDMIMIIIIISCLSR
jgi:hypothetical protein